MKKKSKTKSLPKINKSKKGKPQPKAKKTKVKGKIKRRSMPARKTNVKKVIPAKAKKIKKPIKQAKPKVSVKVIKKSKLSKVKKPIKIKKAMPKIKQAKTSIKVKSKISKVKVVKAKTKKALKPVKINKKAKPIKTPVKKETKTLKVLPKAKPSFLKTKKTTKFSLPKTQKAIKKVSSVKEAIEKIGKIKKGTVKIDAKELQYLRNVLSKRRTDLEFRLEKLEEKFKRTQQEDSGDASSHPIHLGDIATDTGTKEQNSYIISSLVKELRKIHGALDKLESGNYGICEACGKPIPIERLRAIPYAELCMKCGEKPQPF